jgi:hypothetical protein
VSFSLKYAFGYCNPWLPPLWDFSLYIKELIKEQADEDTNIPLNWVPFSCYLDHLFRKRGNICSTVVTTLFIEFIIWIKRR